jgi:hypothetical protein
MQIWHGFSKEKQGYLLMDSLENNLINKHDNLKVQLFMSIYVTLPKVSAIKSANSMTLLPSPNVYRAS